MAFFFVFDRFLLPRTNFGLLRLRLFFLVAILGRTFGLEVEGWESAVEVLACDVCTLDFILNRGYMGITETEQDLIRR